MVVIDDDDDDDDDEDEDEDDDADDDETMGGTFIKEKGGTFSSNVAHAGKFYRILSMGFMFLHPLLQPSQLVSFFLTRMV